MQIAPLPENEESRLRALYEYKILDTPYEEIFDVITKLCASICGAPISLISLLDKDRLWFKSAQGLNSTETSRDIAFCAHTILSSSNILEVPDATKDERFRGNPLVTGDPSIRFYAGVSLINPQGHKLGTLCVLDKIPKHLTAEQKDKMQRLSRIVITLFESKKIISNEMSERVAMNEKLAAINEQLEKQLLEQTKNNNFNILLSQMNGMLQSCEKNEEAYLVISKFSQQIFPNASGSLYLMSAGHDYVELVSSWNSPDSLEGIFLPEDCWALRRGQMYVVGKPDMDLLCCHFKTHQGKFSYICLPLMAQGEIFGLLSVEYNHETESVVFTESQILFVTRAAEQIALSLANIKLRQTLRHQSICDPLTGLYNRRYLSEMFCRELPRAIQKSTKLGVILIDIDHFKKFNDTHGHEAGDTVLKEVAGLLMQHVHENDVVCRFGGEEFVLLLRNVTATDARARAEKLRHAIHNLELKHSGLSLGMITLSLGVALYPQDGTTLEGLINAADTALYKAKGAGRDRVVMHGE